jgi:hypothetical protein
MKRLFQDIFSQNTPISNPILIHTFTPPQKKPTDAGPHQPIAGLILKN